MSIPENDAENTSREPNSAEHVDSAPSSNGGGTTTPPSEPTPIPAPKYGAYAPGWEPGGVHAVAAEREKAAREARRRANEARDRDRDAGAGINTARFGAPAHDALPPEQRTGYPPANAPGPYGAPHPGPYQGPQPGPQPGPRPGPYPSPHPYPGPYPGPYQGPGPQPGPYQGPRPSGFLMPEPAKGTPGYPSTKPGLVTVVGGLVLLIVVPLIIWLAALFGLGSWVGGTNIVTYEVTSGEEFTLPDNQQYVITSPDVTLANRGTECTLKRDGESVELWARPGIEETIHNPGFYFHSSAGDTYVAECTADGQAVKHLEITNQRYLFNFMNYLKPIAIGIGLSFLGFIVCIIGVIMLGRTHSKQRKYRMDPRNYPQHTGYSDRSDNAGPNAGPHQG